MCDPVTAGIIGASAIGAGASLYQGARARRDAKTAQKDLQKRQDEADAKANIPKPTLEDPTPENTEAERRKRVKSVQFGLSSTIKSIDKNSLGLKTKLGA